MPNDGFAELTSSHYRYFGKPSPTGSNTQSHGAVGNGHQWDLTRPADKVECCLASERHALHV